MFREMRRQKNQMKQEDAYQLLLNSKEGVLGTISSNGYPYTVVLNYVLVDNKIYFHSADEGHKIDNIKQNPRVSFTVYDNVEIIEKDFTTKYQSVTVFGTAKLIPHNKEILMKLIEKYAPRFQESGQKYVEKSYTTTQLVEIKIERMTGKERL